MAETMTGRDYQAWGSVFSLIRRQQEELKLLHTRVAYELGFERVPVTDVHKGDVVRSPHTGGWYEVERVIYCPEETEPYYRVVFVDAEGSFEVSMISEEFPHDPLVTRRYTVDEHVF